MYTRVYYIQYYIHCISRFGDHLEHQRMRSLWFSLGIRGWDGTRWHGAGVGTGGWDWDMGWV